MLRTRGRLTITPFARIEKGIFTFLLSFLVGGGENEYNVKRKRFIFYLLGFFHAFLIFLQTVSFFVDVDRAGAMYCVLYCGVDRLVFFFLFRFLFDGQYEVLLLFSARNVPIFVSSASDIYTYIIYKRHYVGV